MPWFQQWFDSPYYHILYRQRDDSDAAYFIDNLCRLLAPPLQARFVDIACGKGRHAVYLNKKGYDVTGIDLSPLSIAVAQKAENERLHFFVHDMRHLFFVNYFDYAFNLFTSFGYFDNEQQHVKALRNFAQSLTKKGIFVLDYFNVDQVKASLTHCEEKTLEGITFAIDRKVVDNKVLKNIRFEHQQQTFSFTEQVQAFSLLDFERLFKQTPFKIEQVFGGYGLEPFVPQVSERLVLICSKKK